jgi:hypothetical protein
VVALNRAELDLRECRWDAKRGAKNSSGKTGAPLRCSSGQTFEDRYDMERHRCVIAFTRGNAS